MNPDLDESSVRYARAIDLEDRKNPHTLALLLVPEGSRVLDVGTATGSVARGLRAHGSRVWGVEIDEEAAGQAANVCEQVVIGDVEQLDLAGELHQHEFDWLLLLDVLEHLRDPLATLERCLPLLAPEGRVLLSLPNIAHASVRLQLLQGRFQYTETGLLDHTHLRFFDEQSMRELLASAKLSIEHEFPIRRSLEEDMGEKLDMIPSDVVREIESDPSGDIYQFVVVARRAPPGDGAASEPVGEGGAARLPTLSDELWNRVDILERLVRQGAEHTRSLTDQIADLKRRNERISDLESVLSERMSELRVRDREFKHVRLDLGLKETHIVDLRKRVIDVTAEVDAARIEAAAARGAHDAAADAAVALRERIVALEWELTQALKRLDYGRYRAADKVSTAFKQLPGAHRIVRLVIETLFRRRR